MEAFEQGKDINMSSLSQQNKNRGDNTPIYEVYHSTPDITIRDVVCKDSEYTISRSILGGDKVKHKNIHNYISGSLAQMTLDENSELKFFERKIADEAIKEQTIKPKAIMHEEIQAK